MEKAAASARVVTVSHYHNDHHTPNFIDPVWLGSTPEALERVYRGKIILAKDSRRKINTAQRRRGWVFKQAVEKIAERFEVADSRTFEFGKTRLRFPEPVPHGEEDSGLGWVLPCIIERSGDKVLFAPDVQGPIVSDTVRLILEERPRLAITGGPPTYLQGFRIGEGIFQKALRNMEMIGRKIETTVIDHHLLRDEGWAKFLVPVKEAAEDEGHKIITAAELVGSAPRPLECRRKHLYEEDEPSKEFLEWAKLPKEKQNSLPPLL